jgi:AraC family L-rhamnose operon regulatory protein RhaS
VIDTQGPQQRAIKDGKIEFHGLSHGSYIGTEIPKDVLPGVSSIGWWNAVGEQDWGLEPHRNEGIEIVYLETGGMVFTVDRKRQDLHAGALTITRPWQMHCLGNPNIGPGRLHWLIIDVGVRRPDQPWRWPRWVSLIREDLDELTVKLRHNEQPVWRGTPEIRHDFQAIAEAIRDNRGRSHISHLIVHLNHLLLNILEALRSQQVAEDPALASRARTVALFFEDLKSNPASLAQEWTLERMAAQCGVGVTALVEHCRALTNLTPVKYLGRCRVEYAGRLLREQPDRSITDVAFDCGFSSSQYFASQFRQHFGCTPRGYRKRKD